MIRATSTNTCKIISNVSAVIGSPPWLVFMPLRPRAGGLLVGSKSDFVHQLVDRFNAESAFNLSQAEASDNVGFSVGEVSAKRAND